MVTSSTDIREDVSLRASGLGKGVELKLKFLAVGADAGVADQP